MRIFAVIGLMLCWTVAGCQKPVDPPKRDKESEEKYARAVATAFLETLKAEENVEQMALTTRAFQARHKSTNGIVTGWSKLSFGLAPGGEKNSSEGDEWLFSGPIQTAPSGGDVVGNYEIRIVKAPESSKWRVDFFTASRTRD